MNDSNLSVTLPELEHVPPPGHFKNVEQFKRLTESHWEEHPEYLATCLDLSAFEPASLTSIYQTLKQIAYFVFRLRQVVFNMPPCDVLIFHSSTKPAYWPALGLLADRLAQRGLRCIVLNNHHLEIRERVGNAVCITMATNYLEWTLRGLNYPQALQVIVRSGQSIFTLWWLALKHDHLVLRNLLHDPFGAWHHLLKSIHRSVLCNYLLTAAHPRLIIVNHERVKTGAELIMSKTATSSFRIQLCNEPPHHVILPFLSDEVWVWNERAAQLIRDVSGEKAPRLAVCGSSEVDVSLENPEPISATEQALQQRTQNKPTLLVLSEYFPGKFYEHHERPLCRNVLAWIGYAARCCPEWHFIYKPRPLQPDLQNVPGMEFVNTLDNFSVANGNIALRQYFHWDNIIAVAAVSSSGLFAAAGVGKIAIRLAVTPNRYCWPVIEEVAINVDSPQSLASTLRRLSQHDTSLSHPSSTAFPYREHVLDRLEELCINRLEGASY